MIGQIVMKSNIRDVYSLTPAQEGIYLQCLQTEDAKTYHFHSLFQINKNADLELLKKSADLLFLRHPVLKSAITYLKSTNTIKQVILENRNCEFTVLLQENRFSQNVLDDIVEQDRKKPFNLQTDTLFKVIIIEFSDKRFMLVRSHHIILDGWCFPIIINDLQRYYEQLFNGKDIKELTDEINKEVLSQTSFAQYVNWLKKQDKSEATKYWQNLLLNCSFSHIFDKSDDRINKETATFRTYIDKETSQKIEGFAKQNRVSNNTIFECAFSIALQKFSGSNDILFDKAISGRSGPVKNIENTVGLFVNTLPVRVQSNENSTLADLIDEIQTQTINTNKYGILSLSEVYKNCNINSRSIDALFAFENYYIGDDIIGDMEKGLLSSKYIFFDEKTEFNLSVAVFKEKGEYIVRTTYSSDLYTEAEMSDFIRGYITILESFSDIEKYIKDISVTDRKLISAFNSTSHSYRIPEGSTIYSLFEKTAKDNTDIICIKTEKEKLTFGELLDVSGRLDSRLRQITKGKKSVIAVIAERSVEMYASIYGIIRGGNAYLPIDPDYPQERINYILENSGAAAVVVQGKFTDKTDGIPCVDMTDFIGYSENLIIPECACEADDTAYVIYTSGSTGAPKGAKVSHRSAVNRILWMHDKYPLEKSDVILQKTPYTFDVSVWEHFWWGMCGGSLAASRPGEHFLPAKILEEVKRNKVTHIHFVPSVFELFLDYLETHRGEISKFNSIRYVFLSGEALTANLVHRFYKLYDSNKVTVHNLYGPTECAVDVTYYDCNPGDVDPVPIGKPIYNTQMYVVDKYNNMVPVGVTGELCIAGENVGAGYLNNLELTAEKFIDNPFGEGKLYKTGDLAYWREDGNIIYVGRSDFQVKIRGLRIELGEIENTIRSMSGVLQCAVIVREDNEGKQYICAYYTGKEKMVRKLRKEIGKTLPQYMMPHIFTYMEKLPMTSSGKLDRKALPEIDFKNIETGTEYLAPETEKEKLVTECMIEVLGAEKVSVLDNFFDIGGDSLKAIEFTAKLEANGYEVPLKTLFECRDIRDLATKLQYKQSEYMATEYDSILFATPAQIRVYTSQMLAPESTLYNIAYAFKVSKIDKNKLEVAVNKLIERHESLRTRFEIRDGEIVQIIEEEAKITVEDIEDINKFSKAFKLDKAPLIRVGCTDDRVVINLHHIITDGESMSVFFRELNELYMGRSLPDTVQYGEFAAVEGYTEENENYWLGVFEEEAPVLEIPADYQRGSKQSFRGSNIYEQIDICLHREIEEKCKERGITPYVYYMACLSIFLSKLSGNEDIVVGTPMSGRTSRYLDTMGMFVNTIALRSRPKGNKKVKELLSEIRDSSIEAIDNQSYPFGELVKKLSVNTMGRNPLFDVMLAYQSYELTDVTFADEKAELIPLTVETSKYDITFSILPRAEDVVLAVEYCIDLFNEERIRNFTEMYITLLEICLDDEKYIKDISVTDRKLISAFNSTSHSYRIPEGSTIYSLFEKTAKDNTDIICIKTEKEKLTFGELLDVSGRLDSRLRQITKGKKSVIAVIAERSVEMYASIYGIIRGGNAYLPIDPDYPQERINYILENSGAAAVVVQGKFTDKTDGIPCVDMTDFIGYSENLIIPECACEADDTAYVIYTSGSTGAPKGAKVSHKSAVNRILWMHDKYPMEESSVILQKTPYTFDVSVWEHFWWGICGGSLAVSKPGEHFLPAKILEETEKNKVTHIHFVPSVFELFLNYLEAHNDEAHKFYSVRYVFLSGEALSAELIQRFYRLFDCSKVTLHNLYGPTECAVDVTYYDCTPTDTDPVPIGKPIYNTQMHILDKYLKPVPIGVTGEICIAGDGVGQGYINNPELTQEKFIDNPFGEGKLYRTGDNGYWREDGNIVFCGRSDFQVKINGQRIELGEIEAVINTINGIDSSVVIVNEKDILTAFYTGKNNREKAIRERCAEMLPYYMIPGAIAHIESLPLNQNGKLDRKKLIGINISFAQKKENEEPINDTERDVCKAFRSVLSVEEIGRNSNFFDLGGSSLSMITLLSEEGFENITASEFIRNPTPSKLAHIMLSRKVENLKYLEPLHIAENAERAMILLPFAGGGAEAFSTFVNTLKNTDTRVSVYFMRYLHSQKECNKAAQEIITALSGREITLYSHCVGSAVALHILQNLENVHFPVKHYFAGASIPPAKPSRYNTWNIVPDIALKHTLSKAGADFNDISRERMKALLKAFRKDTDFANIGYYDFRKKLTTPVTVIISKSDIFTMNYTDAKKLWLKYAENVIDIHFIDSDSHYFQKDNPADLVKIIMSTNS